MNFGKLFFAAVLAGLFLVSVYIYFHRNAEAVRITALLKPYEAQIEEIRPYGRGNYYSFVTLKVNGKRIRSAVDAKLGTVGNTVTVWSKPNFSSSYSHQTQLQERASRSWILFLGLVIPNLFLFSMVVFSKPRKESGPA